MLDQQVHGDNLIPLLLEDGLLVVVAVDMVVTKQQELVVQVEEGNQVLMVQELQKVLVYQELITLVVAVVLVQDSLTVVEEMEHLESL